MFKNMEELLNKAKENKNLIIAIASAEDKPVLEAASKAKKEGVADFLLVGNVNEIKKVASDNNINIDGMQLKQADNPNKAAELAVKEVSSGNAQILMKGKIGTSSLLKHVLNKEYGLRKGKEVITHVAVFQIPSYHKLIALTDGGINIAPDLNTKVSMINSSVEVMRSLGVEKPKVAVLGAVEVVNPAMSATLEAAQLAKMCDRKQIKNCIVDGPFAFDNAISKESAKHKGIVSEVAGDADILITPDINAGNILYKCINFLTNANAAAVLCGAAVPIVLTSRADSDETKLFSIALSTLL